MARSFFAAPFAHLTLIALAMLATGRRPALGQEPTLDSLCSGARVRVTAPPLARTAGILLGLRGDSLVVLGAPSPDTLRFAVGSVRQLDVSMGARRRVGRGSLIGFATGYVVGGLIGLAAVDAGQPSSSNLKGIGTFTGAMLGGGAGLITGIVVGLRPVEQWQSVSLPRSP